MSGSQDQAPNPWAPPPAPGAPAAPAAPAAEPIKPYLPPAGGSRSAESATPTAPPPPGPMPLGTPSMQPPQSPSPFSSTPPAPPTQPHQGVPLGTPSAPPPGPTGPDLAISGGDGSDGGSGSPKRSKATLIGAVAGVTALVAAGAFAVVRITGNDTQGGAASPSEVGTALTTALDNEDVLGVIDLLLPGERDTFREPLVDFVGHLSRLEVLSSDADLSKIGGLDIQFTDVSVREEPTNVADITNIYLSGSSTISVDGQAVPIGDLLIDEAFEGQRPDMDAEPETAEFDDTKLTVVERDGRWYLSVFYSAAESIRSEFDDMDVPETGVEAKGGDSPEGALDTMFQAVSALDLEGAIAALDPTEFEALHRYAPLFLDDAQDAIDDVDIDWGITDTSYEVSGEGSRRTVQITALTFRASVPDLGDVEVTVDGECATVSFGDEPSETICSDEVQPGALDEFGLGSEFRGFVETLQDAVADAEPTGIAVHEVGGQWFVSPMRTGFDAMNGFLAALDADELRDIVQAASGLADGVADDLDDALGDLGVLDGDADAFPIDPSDTDIFDDGTGDDGTGDDGTADGDAGVDVDMDALTECYMADDAAVGVQCMNDGIAAGTIDPDFVQVPVRFPECGVAEVYWSDVYSLSDDDFVAMATAASPCFLDLVEQGVIEYYLLPSELLAPECLEGRNWYMASSDDDYTNRFFECIAEAGAPFG
jgi:hypothetical protein